MNGLTNKPKQRLLLIDNYDSFTFNLKHCLQQNNDETLVLKNDDAHLEQAAMNADKIIISPGPSAPQKSGKIFSILKAYHSQKPILGVCLGMQILNEFLGGKTIKAPYPVHGKSTGIRINNTAKLFKNFPTEINVARYHSLICANIHSTIAITAWENKIPMSFEHKTLPIFAVQFHPESFLTEYGELCIANFLAV
jgi:anthranilate synthase component 2